MSIPVGLACHLRTQNLGADDNSIVENPVVTHEKMRGDRPLRDRQQHGQEHLPRAARTPSATFRWAAPATVGSIGVGGGGHGRLLRLPRRRRPQEGRRALRRLARPPRARWRRRCAGWPATRRPDGSWDAEQVGGRQGASGRRGRAPGWRCWPSWAPATPRSPASSPTTSSAPSSG